MDTQRKSLGLLNITLLCMFISLVLYIKLARDPSSFESFHRSSLLIFLFFWIPMNAFYPWSLISLARLNVVRFGLIPLNLLSVLFFGLIASAFSNGISGSECIGFFLLYFLLVLPLHLLMGIQIRQLIPGKSLFRFMKRTVLFSFGLSVLVTAYLHVVYFPGFLLQNVLFGLVLTLIIISGYLVLLLLINRVKTRKK
jgi:hypothetical protein